MRSFVTAIVAATAAFLPAACGGSETTSAQPRDPTAQISAQPSASRTPATTAPPTRSPSAPASVPVRGTVVKAAASQFGEILFDRGGQAIYLFDKETTAKPECYGECAQAWPPVLTDGEPFAAPGVRADRLGTTTRSNGSTQVTYAGHPLYYYAHEDVNEVLCHDEREFGGLWLAVTPSGAAAPH